MVKKLIASPIIIFVLHFNRNFEQTSWIINILLPKCGHNLFMSPKVPTLFEVLITCINLLPKFPSKRLFGHT